MLSWSTTVLTGRNHRLKIRAKYNLRYRVIFQCESGDSKSIARALETISAVPKDEHVSLGQQGYDWALKNRAYSGLATKFSGLKN